MLLIGVALSGACLFVVLWWWSEATVDASDALLLAVVFCTLTFGLFAAQELWQFLIAFIPLTCAAAYAIYSFKVGGTRAYYKRRCEEYVQAIQTDPRNTGAREFLADALYNMGQLDRAIDEIQAAVDIGAGLECQYKLNKWSRERYIRDTPNPICRRCETENAPQSRTCVKCGTDLPYDNAFSRWLMGGRSAGARCYLIVITGAAVVSVSVLLLPLKFAFIPVVLCLTALAGWSLVGSARS